MKKESILPILLGKKYYTLPTVDEQIKYITMMSIFFVVMFPLTILGITLLDENLFRAILDFSISFLCLLSIILIRTKVPMNKVPHVPVTLFGIYCMYLLWAGTRGGWTGAWILAYPTLSVFLCGLTYGVITSSIFLVGLWYFLFSPWQLGFYNIGTSSLAAQFRTTDAVLSSRLMIVYILIFAITIVYERFRLLKIKKEAELTKDLVYERNTIQIMKDNMNMGVFLMDSNLLIQPQYSQQLPIILSIYDEKLDKKNFLDLLRSSVDSKQQKILVNYFKMIFSKSKSLEVLAEANPLSDFEYTVDNRTKYLSAKFQLVEQNEQSKYILGLLEDITIKKELEQEIQQAQQDQEIEMKNLFDIIQVNPLVFDDFIDTVNDNFKNINEILKDQTKSERDVVIKFFQNIHSIKSNAAILGLENFSKKLHDFESKIKLILNKNEILQEDVFSLTIELETLMKEKDEYQQTTGKLQQFRAKNDVDNILKVQLEQACKKTAEELNKIVTINIKEIDQEALQGDIRKPIKEILLQFIRNSIHHGFAISGEINISIIKENNNIIVNYSDNGNGIDFNKVRVKYLQKYPTSNPTQQQLLAYIFKPEVSTSSTTSMTGGRGVGLSLVKDLISQNKGKMSVGLKNGLTFRITFPG